MCQLLSDFQNSICSNIFGVLAVLPTSKRDVLPFITITIGTFFTIYVITTSRHSRTFLALRYFSHFIKSFFTADQAISQTESYYPKIDGHMFEKKTKQLKLSKISYVFVTLILNPTYAFLKWNSSRVKSKFDNSWHIKEH